MNNDRLFFGLTIFVLIVFTVVIFLWVRTSGKGYTPANAPVQTTNTLGISNITNPQETNNLQGIYALAGLNQRCDPNAKSEVLKDENYDEDLEIRIDKSLFLTVFIGIVIFISPILYLVIFGRNINPDSFKTTIQQNFENVNMQSSSVKFYLRPLPIFVVENMILFVYL